MIKRGRPVKGEGKNLRFELRISLDEWDKLNELSDKFGLSRADIVRKLIREGYYFWMEKH